MNRDTAYPGASLVLEAKDRQWADFPIPGHTGALEAAVLNRDLALGPIVASLRMAPGARIPAHHHERTTKTFLVLEGEFLNAGGQTASDSFLKSFLLPSEPVLISAWRTLPRRSRDRRKAQPAAHPQSRPGCCTRAIAKVPWPTDQSE